MLEKPPSSLLLMRYRSRPYVNPEERREELLFNFVSSNEENKAVK